MKLNDKACKTAHPKDKQYKLSDGGGMFLLVKPNGSKLWRMKYRFMGKEKTLSFGSYPIVTLKDAREARDLAKKLLSQTPPIDPMEHKETEKRALSLKADNTFKSVALEWYENQLNRWSDGYANKVLKGLELNVFPFIGNRPITDIEPPELLENCLRKIERRGSLDIAGRTKQICGQVFRYGIQTGKCTRNPANDLTGAMQTHKKEHFRTIDLKQLPPFLQTLERNEIRLYERTRQAIWLSLYTFCRPQEIRMAKWEHIDFDAKLWTIPAEFMKMRKDHIVPLSKQAIAVLQKQQEELAHINAEWVFPSQIRWKNPMSDGTVNTAIKRMGYGKDMVAHGFRALARTAIAEKLKYPAEVIEKQLAHKTTNPLGEAYDRTQFIDDRIQMMQDWADWIDDQSMKK